jgi:hypothetical protein
MILFNEKLQTSAVCRTSDVIRKREDSGKDTFEVHDIANVKIE